ANGASYELLTITAVIPRVRAFSAGCACGREYAQDLRFFGGDRKHTLTGLFSSMLTRRQELNTQLQQLIDAFLLAFSLWAGYALRYYSTFCFDLSKSVDPLRNYHWLLIVIMPFGPVLLDLQGFYESPLNKTNWKSFMQIVRAMIGLSIIVSACVIFLRRPLA